jgi:hypothetical protein
METALFLTNSIGGIAVYAGGWALICMKDKSARQTFITSLPQILSAALAAAAIFSVARFILPQAAILPVIVIFLVQKPLSRLPAFKHLPLITAIGGLAAFSAVFAVAGMRPLATYIERLIHISDGIRTMLTNPLGIGAGMWALEFPARQSAYYNASVLHSGYATIAAEAGVIALVCCVGLIFLVIKTQSFSKYTAALCMIFAHALFDFSLSFLAVSLLLCLLAAAGLKGCDTDGTSILASENNKAIPNLIFFVPLALCAALLIPQSIKNRAIWMYNSGNHTAAYDIMSPHFMQSDPEALILRLRYAYAADSYEKFSETFKTFESRSISNSEAYYLAARMAERQGDNLEAARLAALYVSNSPYFSRGYALADGIAKKLEAEEQESYLKKIELIKNNALDRENPLAAFIPKNASAAQ